MIMWIRLIGVNPICGYIKYKKGEKKMKKVYGTPKAEKMEFNYSEAVVASSTGCDWFYTKTQHPEGCMEVEVKQWHPEVG